MDLSRLRSIVGQQRLPSVPPRRELTYEPVGADGLPLPARHELPSIAGAAWERTDHGDVVVVDHEFPAAMLHGRARVEDLAPWDPASLSLLNGRPLGAAVPRDRQPNRDGVVRSPLFFDLETTGLSGGAGTVPFLVGCGYFEDGYFRTRQFFLQGFAAERAMLDAVSRFVEGTPVLVTYNGRTFDVPVMETRWLFHRMPIGLDGVPHLDMLPASRRLWREASDEEGRSCRLVALEHRICGVTRVGDVPGVEIPQRYFEYVRYGDSRLLEPVLYHNRMDLLSLAALVGRAQRLVREGATATSGPAECLGLGRFFECRAHRPGAEECYRLVAASPAATFAQREQALHALALLLRRSKRYGEAAGAWRELLGTGVGRTCAVRDAIEALAVHHEHRQTDLQEAMALATRALHLERDPRRREAVRYRLARLERKLARFERGMQPRLPEADGAEGAGRKGD